VRSYRTVSEQWKLSLCPACLTKFPWAANVHLAVEDLLNILPLFGKFCLFLQPRGHNLEFCYQRWHGASRTWDWAARWQLPEFAVSERVLTLGSRRTASIRIGDITLPGSSFLSIPEIGDGRWALWLRVETLRYKAILCDELWSLWTRGCPSPCPGALTERTGCVQLSLGESSSGWLRRPQILSWAGLLPCLLGKGFQVQV